jgi:ribosome maturation factor RimP
MKISTHFNEVKMNLDNLKTKLLPFLKPYNLEIYSIKLKREYGEKIVEILLDIDTMNIDDLEKIHMAYVDSLDDDDIDDDYYLEISSLGAERPIDNLKQLSNYIGKYIYFETNKMKNIFKLLEVDLEKEILLVEVNLKGRFAKIEVNYNETRKMRLAVKV